MKKNDTIIKIDSVSKAFDGVTVLDEVSLDIKRGEFVTLLGPSGCGKTTLLRLIAGFALPDSGSIYMEGEDITHVPPYQRPLNTVFQRYALFPHLDVYDNVAFGLRLQKMPKDEIDKKVRKVLKMVSMTGYEDRDVESLSGGQQQRVAIARAIVNQPKVLLLDEPLAALDLKMRKDMQIELKEMHQKLGITFIYVTHDQEEALTLSDTIVVVNEGRIQQIGTPAISGCGSANSATFVSWGKYKFSSIISPVTKSTKHGAWKRKLLHRQQSFCSWEKYQTAAPISTTTKTALIIFCHIFNVNTFLFLPLGIFQ